MPQFQYEGRDGSGERVSGTLEVATPDAAAMVLAGRGITPVRIAALAGAGTGSRESSARPARRAARMTIDELQLFSRQLHALLRGGLPIMRALSAMQDSATRPALGAMLGELSSSLDQGRELSAAMARHPQDFPPLYVAMVRVGEQTGRLDDILRQLAGWLEFDRKSRERVKAALRYPSFVVAAMAIALVVVNLFVIPRFAGVYKSMKVDLPWMTQLLIGFSDFMVGSWPLLLAGVAGGAWAFRTWKRTDGGRALFDQWVLRVPIAGRILRHAALARFARSLSMTLRSGLPASQGIQLVAHTVGNAYMSNRLERVRTGIERGESLLRACSGTRAFTPLVLQMIAVGEESGTVDEMLEHVATFYEEDVDYDLARLSSAIEPILIVVLGAIVLVLALGVFLPIWDLGKAALGRSG
ncbi:MAG: type II secretion system F family protein [Burkholderiaceae bacterium]